MATIKASDKYFVIAAEESAFVYDSIILANLSNDSNLVSAPLVKLSVAEYCTEASNSRANKNGDKNGDKKAPDSNSKTKANESVTVHRIINCNFSSSGALFALITSSKFLLIFNAEKEWSLLSLVAVPKAPTAVLFDSKNNILFSDRAGSLRILQNDALVKGENGSKELLGHLSMLLDCCLSMDECLVMTADRDEKIKISRYPQTFVIENFCLGHTSFVSSICPLSEHLLASGGGESVIHLWDISTGETICASEKLCNEPVKKILPIVYFNMELSEISLIVVPEDSAKLFRLDYNEADQLLRISDTITVDKEDDVFFDACISHQKLVAVGRKGIYIANINTSPLRLHRQMDQISESNELMACLSRCVNSFPLKDLYKCVEYENLEKYYEAKAERTKRQKKITSE